MYIRVGKKILDLIIVIPAILLTSPLIVFFSLLIKINMKAPPFFRQLRPGLGGKPFKIFKLRTMVDKRDGNGVLLPDDQRLTKLGRFLRTTSLDELPELFNVLRGDMSLVGPRPLLMEYLPLYTPEQARRHEVKPGITGWAQVNGRNALTWEEKFEHDLWYVKIAKGEINLKNPQNSSYVPKSLFHLDLKILAMTLLNVIKMKGISQPGRATMEKFKGSKKS